MSEDERTRTSPIIDFASDTRTDTVVHAAPTAVTAPLQPTHPYDETTSSPSVIDAVDDTSRIDTDMIINGTLTITAPAVSDTGSGSAAMEVEDNELHDITIPRPAAVVRYDSLRLVEPYNFVPLGIVPFNDSQYNYAFEHPQWTKEQTLYLLHQIQTLGPKRIAHIASSPVLVQHGRSGCEARLLHVLTMASLYQMSISTLSMPFNAYVYAKPFVPTHSGAITRSSLTHNATTDGANITDMETQALSTSKRAQRASRQTQQTQPVKKRRKRRAKAKEFDMDDDDDDGGVSASVGRSSTSGRQSSRLTGQKRKSYAMHDEGEFDGFEDEDGAAAVAAQTQRQVEPEFVWRIEKVLAERKRIVPLDTSGQPVTDEHPADDDKNKEKVSEKSTATHNTANADTGTKMKESIAEEKTESDTSKDGNEADETKSATDFTAETKATTDTTTEAMPATDITTDIPVKKPFVRLHREHALATMGDDTDIDTDAAVELKAPDDQHTVITEYLVKIEGQSYLHVEWHSRLSLVEKFGDWNVSRRLNQYIKTKKTTDAQNADRYGGEPFDPRFVIVDRIIASSVLQLDEDSHTPSNNDSKDSEGKPKEVEMFNVKWQGLSYSQCTWETGDDIGDELKIAQFRRFNRPIQPGQPSYSPQEFEARKSQWYRESSLYKGKNRLRDYQVQGINWLIHAFYDQRNCILADEMGLGKTVQCVTFYEHLRRVEHIVGPFLVIIPLGTISHWKREVESWTDMNVVIYHDVIKGRETRDVIREYEFYYPGTRKVKFNILVTTYEVLIADIDIMTGIPWQHVTIDEGHRLKNKSSKILECLRQLRCPRRLLLTGTPIQNNTLELWTLLNFLEPNVFNNSQSFSEHFGNVQESEQVAALQQRLRPYVLRRMKEAVEKSIPPKEETIIDIELTTIQKKYYRAIYEKNLMFLRQGVSRSNMPRLVNIEVELRKCCIAAGTPVTLASGVSVPIEKFVSGAVLAYSVDSGMCESINDAVLVPQPRRECIELLFNDGRTLTCTPDHLLLTTDGRWMQAADVAAQHLTVLAGLDCPTVTGGHSMNHLCCTSARDVGEREVFDLTVPQHHNFLANGVVVHNCNHPFLIVGAEDKELGPSPVSDEEYMKKVIAASGKMVLLDKLLPKMQREGHRVLIFSQFVGVLDIIQEYCDYRGYFYERLDGAVRGNEREAAIDRFVKPGSNRFIFLLSTRAGGVGLNLATADTVIIFDSDWNPQQDMQAQARAHRIGQKNKVNIYRLVTRNTYESQMFLKASMKLGLDHAVLTNLELGKGEIDVDDKASIDKILRLGAYGLFDEDDRAAKEFEERNIDEILEKHSHVVTFNKTESGDGGEGGEGSESAEANAAASPEPPTTTTTTSSTSTSTSGSGVGGRLNYQKMSFASEKSVIDLNDTNFWEKLMGDSNVAFIIPPDELLSQLTDKSAYESDDSKERFWAQLRKTVEAILAAKKKGEEPAELDNCINLLIQFEATKPFQEHRAEAKEWRIQLESRERRARTKFQESEFEDVRRSRRRGVYDEKSYRKKNRPGEESDEEDVFGGEDSDAYSDRDNDITVGGRVRGKGGAAMNTDVCGECWQSGSMLGCEGMCDRWFHLHCLGLDAPPPNDQPWQCADCLAKEHSCRICGIRSVDIFTPGNGVRCCSIPRCGLFYHIECVRQNPYATFHPGSSISFKCPTHTCHRCPITSESQNYYVRCLNCTIAVHVKCMNRSDYRIAKKFMICENCAPALIETEKGKGAVEGSQVHTQGEPVRKKVKLKRSRVRTGRGGDKSRNPSNRIDTSKMTPEERAAYEAERDLRRKESRKLSRERQKERRRQKREQDRRKRRRQGNTAEDLVHEFDRDVTSSDNQDSDSDTSSSSSSGSSSSSDSDTSSSSTSSSSSSDSDEEMTAAERRTKNRFKPGLWTLKIKLGGEPVLTMIKQPLFMATGPRVRKQTSRLTEEKPSTVSSSKSTSSSRRSTTGGSRNNNNNNSSSRRKSQPMSAFNDDDDADMQPVGDWIVVKEGGEPMTRAELLVTPMKHEYTRSPSPALKSASSKSVTVSVKVNTTRRTALLSVDSLTEIRRRLRPRAGRGAQSAVSLGDQSPAISEATSPMNDV